LHPIIFCAGRLIEGNLVSGVKRFSKTDSEQHISRQSWVPWECAAQIFASGVRILNVILQYFGLTNRIDYALL
jgi:hypothetical protein